MVSKAVKAPPASKKKTSTPGPKSSIAKPNQATPKADPKTGAGIAPPAEGKVPVHSIKVSKKGLVWVHVTLPKSVPPSVIHLDAKPNGFHVDTGKWGGGYTLDAPWPEGVKVHLVEGEEAEAQLKGGQLTVCFRVEGAEVPAKKQGGGKQQGGKAGGKQQGGKPEGKQQVQKPKGPVGPEPAPEAAAERAAKKGKGDAGGGGKGAAAPAKGGDKAPKAGEKRPRAEEGKPSAGGKGGGEGKKKKLVVSKDETLRLVEDVAGKEEDKVQDKLDKEDARLGRIEAAEQKREERRRAKQQKKADLVQMLKKKGGGGAKGKAGTKPLLKGRREDEDDGEGAGGMDSPASSSGRRVSWGADSVRSFKS